MDWDDIYIEAHDQLIDEYLNDNPSSTEDEAYQATLDLVEDRVVDIISEMSDRATDTNFER